VFPGGFSLGGFCPGVKYCPGRGRLDTVWDKLTWARQTHDEVDVEEEADVEHEVRGAGDDQAPHVDRLSRVEAVHEEQRHSGVPYADAAQYSHRRQNVLVLPT